jgi:hypothetical protein
MGRRPTGDRPLTTAERSRLYRARHRKPAPVPDPIAPVIAVPASLYKGMALCLAPDKTPSPERYRSVFAEFLKLRWVRL